MDGMLSAAAVLALSIPLGFAFALFAVRGPDLMAGFFGPVRDDPWPRGLQEEDPSFDRTFRLGPAAALPGRDDDDEDGPAPPTARVSAAVRRRR